MELSIHSFNHPSILPFICPSIHPITHPFFHSSVHPFIHSCIHFFPQDKFPPTIYYKIFTCRTIVDMCTFSPRDYTAMSERRQLGQDLHNTNSRILPVNTDSWYRRQENNGWRPISVNVIVQVIYLFSLVI